MVTEGIVVVGMRGHVCAHCKFGRSECCSYQIILSARRSDDIYAMSPLSSHGTCRNVAVSHVYEPRASSRDIASHAGEVLGGCALFLGKGTSLPACLVVFYSKARVMPYRVRRLGVIRILSDGCYLSTSTALWQRLQIASPELDRNIHSGSPKSG